MNERRNLKHCSGSERRRKKKKTRNTSTVNWITHHFIPKPFSVSLRLLSTTLNKQITKAEYETLGHNFGHERSEERPQAHHILATRRLPSQTRGSDRFHQPSHQLHAPRTNTTGWRRAVGRELCRRDSSGEGWIHRRERQVARRKELEREREGNSRRKYGFGNRKKRRERIIYTSRFLLLHGKRVWCVLLVGKLIPIW